MAEETQTLPIKIEPIVQQITEIAPKLSLGRDRAVEAMSKITDINSDEEYESVNNLLVKVRKTYDNLYEMRKGITDQTDELKKWLMSFEKDLAADNKDSDAFRLRNVMSAYNQKKIDAKKKIEEEAARKKLRENHKVDVIASIKKNLSDMIIQRIQQVEDGSRDYFNATTLTDFEDRMSKFKKFSGNPKLKQQDYDACFNVSHSLELMSLPEFVDVQNAIKKEETYDKWNEIVKKEVIPKLNDWIGRIPELKAKLDAKEKAKGDAAAMAALEAENKRKEAEEQRVRQAEIDKKKRESEESIAQMAVVDKIQNDFVEQAVTQSVENTGPVKLIMRFNEEKPVKALTEIMYHCFTNPKFPDIRKKDKDGVVKVDEHGFPVYADWVESLVSFFLKNCDVNIGGLEIKEVPKVIVRK